MLNNGVFVEAAQSLARRVLAIDGNDDTQRLAHACRLCVQRPPLDDEVAVLAALLQRCREYYLANPDAAKQMVGPYAIEDTANEELAAWIATVRTVLNLDEFITRE